MVRGPRSTGARQPFSKLDDGCWVEGRGVVVRLLHDDDEGERHQRFVLDLRNGQTLLVAHNIDIAPRAPVGMGDRVAVRGIYEWNPQGGLVHWTHRDPAGVEDGGWLRFRKREYA